jgi:hypothetical protein
MTQRAQRQPCQRADQRALPHGMQQAHAQRPDHSIDLWQRGFIEHVHA